MVLVKVVDGIFWLKLDLFIVTLLRIKDCCEKFKMVLFPGVKEDEVTSPSLT
jgi:hypothetical protein